MFGRRKKILDQLQTALDELRDEKREWNSLQDAEANKLIEVVNWKSQVEDDVFEWQNASRAAKAAAAAEQDAQRRYGGIWPDPSANGQFDVITNDISVHAMSRRERFATALIDLGQRFLG